MSWRFSAIDFLFGTEKALFSGNDLIGARIRNHQTENEPRKGRKPRTGPTIHWIQRRSSDAGLWPRPGRGVLLVACHIDLSRLRWATHRIHFLSLPYPQPRSTARSPYPGDYPCHFKVDAVGCKSFLLIYPTRAHSYRFPWPAASPPTSTGHRPTSPTNSVTLFTDGGIKVRVKSSRRRLDVDCRLSRRGV